MSINPGPSDELPAWLALEAEQNERRERGAGCGVIPRDRAMALSGLALMQGMLHGEQPYPPISKLMSFTMVQAEHGLAVFQGTPKEEHWNPMGGVHGGWYATLLDSALGCAVQTVMPAGRGYTTAELSVNLVRAIPVGVQRVRAIAKVVHAGRQLATAEARLVGPDGKLYAHGTTTCLVFELPSAKGA
jgi:uncharacterized protein (TIGR00369 family)